jgi:hypothetical protein
MLVPNLTPLRTGDITLEAFHSKFNQDININFNAEIGFEKFKEIFNSMSVVDEASLERIAEFTKILNDNKHIKFLLVSHTNHSHLQFILDQISSKLPCFGIIDATNKWPQDAQIFFCTVNVIQMPRSSRDFKICIR